MSDTNRLLENNRRWADAMARQNPDFFSHLSVGQAPPYLWISCSDSRVPANQIVDLPPGDLFVHRNIANLVMHTDLNCLSVMQFAVETLKVEHVIVCGHYGCGGVLAALKNEKLGLIDNWLRQIQEVGRQHAAELDALATEAERHRRLCELNVMAQVNNVSRTTVVREAWARGQSLTVHGWIYDLADGLLHNLDVSVAGAAG